MTKPLNIYALSRIREESPFNIVEKHHTQKPGTRRTQAHEMGSLRRLVDALLDVQADSTAKQRPAGTSVLTAADMDGFFFSYQIPHIGKEFDLLKIGERTVLNIELKSEAVPEEQIRRQLLRNRYYLSHLDRKVRLFTVVTDTMTCWRLDMPEGRTLGNMPASKTDGDLVQTDIAEIAAAVKELGCANGSGSANARNNNVNYVEDIDTLFRASDYLISPMETPERFIRGEYFLTQAQERVKDLIFAALSQDPQSEESTETDSAQITSAPADGPTFLHITGKPGTGKTLLLYDIAKTLSEVGRTLLVHCGDLQDGQRRISKEMPMLDIISAEVLADGAEELGGYRFVLADESHRMDPLVFDKLCGAVRENGQVCIFSSDPEQIYSAAERENDIAGRIRKLPLAGEYELSEKIRANKELLAFILSLKDRTYEPPEHERYDHVELCYAADPAEAQQLLALYRGKGYTFINYAVSRPHGTQTASAQTAGTQPNTGAGASLNTGAGALPSTAAGAPPSTAAGAENPYAAYEEDFSADQIIGREFDDVVMLLDNSFYYDEAGKLQGTGALEPDYLYPNLFYHGVTRVRERLALIVVGAPELFAEIANIVK